MDRDMMQYSIKDELHEECGVFGAYALDGQVKKIAAGTYLFCPQNMDIGGDLGSSHTDTDGYL